MTELEKLYSTARAAGLDHREALRQIAAKTHIDVDSIARTLHLPEPSRAHRRSDGRRRR